MSMPFRTSTMSLTLALAGALACTALPASAAGLLGTVGGIAAGATGSVGGAVGLGAGGSPLTGGLTGSGNGALGATLGSTGLQSGFGSASPVAATSGNNEGLGGGRAWGTFEEAKGAVSGTAAQTKQRVGGLTTLKPKSVASAATSGAGKSRAAAGGSTPAAATTQNAGSTTSAGLMSHTDGIVLSRSVALPAGALAQSPAQGPAQGPVQAKAKASAAASGSARNAHVAANASGSAQVAVDR